MRKLGQALLVATMIPSLAFAQESAQEPAPTADDFVCALSGECPEETGQSEEGQSGGPRITATRGFQLSRPQAPAPATSQPAQPRSTQRMTSGGRAVPRQAASAAASQQRRVDLRLSFGLGSAVLSPAEQTRARAFAEALRRPQLANARVRIEGHTDSRGGRAMNLTLSQRRAQAVADYLISQGIAPGRLEVRGYGYDQPLPGLPASSQQNRRVEAARIS